LKFHALICAYNCADTIFDCLKSLVSVVDDIIILDAKWIGYDGLPYSTDGTQIEITRFMELYPEVEVKYSVSDKEMHQYEARNFLLNQIPEGDWFLIIDSDETVGIHPTMLKETFDLFQRLGFKGLRIASAEGSERKPQIMDMARVFRKTKGLHYTTNHRYLDDDSGPITYGNMPITDGFSIIHFGDQKMMRLAAEKYKHWLVDWEARNISKSNC
jgi:glycosyltransferase involved in cell wall biosynthesis